MMSSAQIPAEYLNQIVTGDARVLSERLPDESVDLIFTDPVYWNIEDYYWLGKEAVRVLKPESAALVFFGVGLLPQTLDAVTAYGLKYRWYIPHLTPGTSGYCDTGPSRQMGMLWLEKGRTKPSTPLYDVVFTNGVQDWHIWRKNLLGITRWLEAFSKPGGVVWDAFTGGGSIPAVCKMLGRDYIAFEIDAATAESAREHVAMTKFPLFVLGEEQAELDLTGAA
jgi:hypothetical protein